jgi:hypothetical protein
LKSVGRLQDQTSVLLATFLLEEGGTGSRFEDFADTFVGLGRAFEILVCADLLANFLTLVSNVLADVSSTECSFNHQGDGSLKQVLEVFKIDQPVPESRASAKSCATLQWSSGRSGDLSCSRQGLWGDLDRSEEPQRSTVL